MIANLWTQLPRSVRWILTDTLCVTTAAAVYGALFGALEASIIDDPNQVVLSTGRFAFGGSVAGMILGGLGALTESSRSSRPVGESDRRQVSGNSYMRQRAMLSAGSTEPGTESGTE